MDPFLGEIRMFAFNFAPVGWLLCNGQSLSIRQYSALFALLGVQFGGDGVNNFNLPDYRGRFPLSMGQQGASTYAMGQVGGAETTILTMSNMPAHSHTLNASSTEAATDNPNGATLANARSNTYIADAPNVAMNAGSIGTAGAGTPFSNMPPFQCINFCISISGYFPTRP
jgi:microcystin-dependent protein